MHAAHAGEDGERVRLGPALGRLGPLGGPVVVAHVLAGPDQAAVHLAGRERPEAALDGEQHRLVEVAHALVDLALVDEDPPRGLQGLGLQVGRRQAPAEVEGLGGQRDRLVELAGAVGGLGLPEQEVAVGVALGVRLQRPAGPAQPAAGDGGPGVEGVVLPQPHRALAGPAAIPERVVGVEGGLPRRDALVEPTEPPRRLRLQVEPVGLLRVAGRVRGAGRVEGGRPVVARDGGERRRERVVAVHRLLVRRGHGRNARTAPAQLDGASCGPMCSSTGRRSSAGLNSMKTTPSSVQPVWPPGQ